MKSLWDREFIGNLSAQEYLGIHLKFIESHRRFKGLKEFRHVGQHLGEYLIPRVHDSTYLHPEVPK